MEIDSATEEMYTTPFIIEGSHFLNIHFFIHTTIVIYTFSMMSINNQTK